LVNVLGDHLGDQTNQSWVKLKRVGVLEDKGIVVGMLRSGEWRRHVHFWVIIKQQLWMVIKPIKYA
jgi:hypothetical protein